MLSFLEIVADSSGERCRCLTIDLTKRLLLFVVLAVSFNVTISTSERFDFSLRGCSHLNFHSIWRWRSS
tara:strand:- start:551 stop:757 length:207 start_codon:yes stop_codon:yes gene_type:complete